MFLNILTRDWQRKGKRV